MKKSHPHPSTSANPEPLYAKVNKPHRGQGPSRPEEPVYADLDFERRRGQHSRQLEETVYAAVAAGGNGRRSPRQSEEIVYADLDFERRGGQHSRQLEETVYAAVAAGGNGRRSPRQSEETVYADLDFERRGGQHPRQPEETVYAAVAAGGNGRRSPQPSQEATRAAAHPGRSTPPLGDINKELKRHVGVRYGEEKISHLCAIVYGNPDALKEKLNSIIENPGTGEEVLWDLASNPQSVGKLAGRKVFGIKSPKRRQAEGEFNSLCSAFEKHVNIVEKVRNDIERQYRKHKGPENTREQQVEREEQVKVKSHHHTREKQPTVPEQSRQPRKAAHSKGMAFAM
ncbi:hypothetical protein MEC_00022 [Bartonella alsatica IBS 382]|uniref:Bartonella effector protein BID domain-containing protein n=1 Tax=Bartonella alsatica IBS 382 TaxID=1094551 RepID=J0Q110_9HYPH|nr:BID domain-containing T4SS effector [Bartonella alsatica]EJF76219.1 hypothetical protein MEC_00022 [Bartonella alsatica IBS 382]